MSRNRFKCTEKTCKAALQLSREIGVLYKTAWLLLMKLREIAWRREEMVLDGEVESMIGCALQSNPTLCDHRSRSNLTRPSGDLGHFAELCSARSDEATFMCGMLMDIAGDRSSIYAQSLRMR
ncbi:MULTISPECIES: hypothetical protein [Rhizobium]|uniref:Uncharacterized protein n=2 Tax=Rhizobium TaxID=379 RepID=A0A2A5KL82_9HYPH|nr:MULTISPECIES: hypothetical protein [Rhizobium]AIC30062.1 hypothetical protein IE4771_PB00336 [Rhizobium sp. IE4771]PCK77810.1 hypothetical protein CPT34_28220 [Rhizobium sophoriradicis]